MQFPKARRFTEQYDSDVPPVGAYDVPAQPNDPAYKRGAMLEKANRFREGERVPDTFGLYDVDTKENRRPRVVSHNLGVSTIDKARQQVDDVKSRLAASHERELAKLQMKIVRLEAVREESSKEKLETLKEMSNLKAEIRSLVSRESATAAKLTKSEASLSKYSLALPKLQQQLETLSTSHAESRKRKEAELATVLTASQAKDEQIVSLRQEVRESKAKFKLERLAREEAAETCEEMVEDFRDELNSIRVPEFIEAKYKIAKLERQLGDRSAQVTALVEYSAQLEERVQSLADDLAEAEDELFAVREEWEFDRNERTSEKEWRQRNRSDQREISSLREEIENLMSIRQIELQVEETGRTIILEKEQKTNSLRENLETELEIAQGELELTLSEEIPRLESSLVEAHETADELRDRLMELQEGLAVSEKSISELQTRALETTERYETELEALKRVVLEKDQQVEKIKAEKKKITGLLGQAKSGEMALVEERDTLLTELGKASELERERASLVQENDLLARENSAMQHEAAELEAQNSELLSHNNPHQKIKLQAQTRTELIESKRAILAVTSKLAASEARNGKLEAELATYKSISPLPHTLTSTLSAAPARSRVSRSHVQELLSLSIPPGPASQSSLVPSTVTGTVPAQNTLSESVNRANDWVIEEEEEPESFEAQPVKLTRTSVSSRASFGAVKVAGRMSVSELF